MLEFETENGASVKISVAPFRDTMELKNAITREVASSGANLDVENFSFDSDIDPMTVFRIAASVDSSEAVYTALFKCLARCTYNGEKITEKTFEAVEARENYYEIALKCAEENLRPFFKGLFAKLKTFRETIKTSDSPKSK